MKSMTCRQMGGPCDTVITGNTPEEMVQNGAVHVQSSSDADHQQVSQMMMDMLKDPEATKKWNEEFAAKFAALPDAN